MQYIQFIIAHLNIIIPALISCCFLVVNIIQAVRTHDKSKLTDVLCSLSDFICDVEKVVEETPNHWSTTTTLGKSVYKKVFCIQLLKKTFGEKFIDKYISVIDVAIEDILNTPQKKGGSIDAISKENDER